MKRLLNTALTLILAMTMIGCTAQNVNTLRQPNRTHTISKTIKGGTIAVGDGSTLVFQKGGKIMNATITGRNIKIVPYGNNVAFENCNFTNATIVNSQLQATNLGLVANMTSKPYSYTYKGIRVSTTKNQGTDNTRAWQQLAQFLSNSSGVKITFKGNFYSGENVKFVKITDARNMELSGGSVIMQLTLMNCNNVSVHDMKFVGYQGTHDFPPIFTKGDLTFNGVRYNTSNAFLLKTDRIASMGVAGDGIRIEIDNDNKRSENITVQRCHFEMRQNGMIVGVRSDKRIVRNVKCLDCTASHIIYQPVGFHASDCQVNNMVAKYCLQGVDISTCSNNITVTNSRFTSCACGPKQESTQEFRSMTHTNVIDGCYFGINDDYMLLDGSQYILNVSEGAKGDVFNVRNTTFDVKKDRLFGSIRSRTDKVVLENVIINIDNRLNARSDSKWSMSEMFAIFGATDFAPKFELNNVNINLASGTKINTMCAPHSNGKVMNVKATGLKVNGNGTIDTYFNTVNSVEMNGCTLAVPSATVAKSVNTMDATGCDIENTKCLFVNDNSNATLRLKSNTIKSEKVVDFKATPKLMEIQGNNIEMTGGEAFAGADSNAKLSTKNFKVSGNSFTRKAANAKLMPNNSKSSKLLNNNIVK
ncbi:MAG: hypothetical protein IKX63_03965 [Muribaculaceae bacterium]|nr:hypothetical protein [Muribaculaceae bacterium]